MKNSTVKEDGLRRYLGWDTSSLTGVVSAFEVRGEKLTSVAEWSLSFETSRHSERLLWTVDTVLQSAGWTMEDLSGIVVGIGPGSFTGLRIGLTSAKIFATQLNLPLIPVSSLALLARSSLDPFVGSLSINPKWAKTVEKALVMVCTDATKGEWFTLMGPLQGILEGSEKIIESTLTPDEVVGYAKKYLKKNRNAPWIAFGQSVERYAEVFQALPLKRRIQSPLFENSRVNAQTLSRMGFEAISGGLLADPQSVLPRYLRASEAEVKLQKGLLVPARGGIA